jgi:RNA polymerase sigma factor (sigma-70 family)
MGKIDEQDILNRLQNPLTRRRAFESIVNVYSRQLYWQIHYILQNHDDTDDVLQNTFIKAWKGIERFKGDSAMYTWLYRIAHNEAITFLKQRKQLYSIDDEDFEFSETEFTIAIGGTKSVTLQYAPVNWGTISRTISVTSNAMNGVQKANVVADPFSVNELAETVPGHDAPPLSFINVTFLVTVFVPALTFALVKYAP